MISMSIMLQCFTIVHVLGLGVCANITHTCVVCLYRCVCEAAADGSLVFSVSVRTLSSDSGGRAAVSHTDG